MCADVICCCVISLRRQEMRLLRRLAFITTRRSCQSSLTSSRLQVDDGCPLWAWRGCVEVEASPTELLQRLLREQHLWDSSLCQAAVVRPLSPHAELYHSLHQDPCQGPGARPPHEQLLLRWAGPLVLHVLVFT